MKGRLQTSLQKQTVTLSIWTWAFCFICMIQTGYILFMHRDVAVSFVLPRNMLDWLSEKWHDRRQYYEVYGEIRLRKAVSVALCIVSVTFALIAGKYIPLDINVVSWWISFSVGLNLLYHSCCNNNHD